MTPPKNMAQIYVCLCYMLTVLKTIRSTCAQRFQCFPHEIEGLCFLHEPCFLMNKWWLEHSNFNCLVMVCDCSTPFSKTRFHSLRGTLDYILFYDTVVKWNIWNKQETLHVPVAPKSIMSSDIISRNLTMFTSLHVVLSLREATPI